MKRLILISLIFFNTLFACSICSVYSPRTDVTLDIQADKELIKSVKVNWTFARGFVDELVGLYDMNLDGNIDEKELKFIENALLAYIEPKNYLTFISYGNKINKTSNRFRVENPKTSYKNKELSFDYRLILNYKVAKNRKLHIKIDDPGGYFLIHFANDKHSFNIPYRYDMASDVQFVTYTIFDDSIAESIDKTEEIQKNEKKLIVDLTKEDMKIQTNKELTFLEKYTKDIKKYLIKIEEDSSSTALIFLLFASFIYGVIHALGPGHGKALAFSYFTAQKSSFLQAFSISMATAFIHILGAFILVVISVFILQSVLNNFIENSISYLTMLCAVLIMFLSIYILYRKLKHKSYACASCTIQNDSAFKLDGNFEVLRNSSNKPIISNNSRKKQDLYFVLTAGLIPCPGTVLLFVYAFILETYFSVILASIAISLGMGIVIFASSFLGLSVNKISNKSHKLTNALEIIAPIFMFGLGVLLLIGANI